MMRALVLVPLASLTLGGCNLLFPEDPRLGDETVQRCVDRVRATMTRQDLGILDEAGGTFIPTYTYDVTKLDFEAIKALTGPGVDDTAGTRLMQETNRTSTAVQRFMAMEVDDKGALFLGLDPALYRVRGKPTAPSEILVNGCDAQQMNMRLIEVSWLRPGEKPKPKPGDPNYLPDTPSSETSS